MPLPPSAPRRRLHHREIRFEGFIRDDGLWEVEGFLTDYKPFDFHSHQGAVHPANSPIHDMAVRVVLNDAHQIVDICSSMDSVPFRSCPQAGAYLRALIGSTVGRGWKETVREKIPRHVACTHVSELLITLATVVFQTEGFGKAPEGSHPLKAMGESGERPFFVDKCVSWREDSELVSQVFPNFYRGS